jgi:chromosome segregation ATPase
LGRGLASPHPDPNIEGKLQEVITLLDRIKTKKEQTGSCSKEIDNLNQQIRKLKQEIDSAQAKVNQIKANLTASELRYL